MDRLNDYLRTLEERLLQTSVRTDAQALDGLLANDFREFGSSGKTYTKSEIVAALVEETPRPITLMDFKMIPLSPTVALVTCRSRSEAGEALRSSIWVERGEGWQMLFHQGTKVPGLPDEDAVS